MTVATVETFYALLAIVAISLVAVTLFVQILAFLSIDGRMARDRIAAVVAPNALLVATMIAVLATAGSLFFSQVAHFEPCRLCWYQRMAMYPLIVILGFAAWRHDRHAVAIARVFAVVGACISTYHVALERLPGLDTGACGTGPACTVIWFQIYGFVTIPFLALSAFLLILALLSFHEPTEVPA
jgi:disulfide bond formation protein DsbB